MGLVFFIGLFGVLVVCVVMAAIEESGPTAKAIRDEKYVTQMEKKANAPPKVQLQKCDDKLKLQNSFMIGRNTGGTP